MRKREREREREREKMERILEHCTHELCVVAATCVSDMCNVSWQCNESM